MKKTVSQLFFMLVFAFCLQGQTVVNVAGNITASTTWTANNVYDLSAGFHYVTNGAVLTIEPGTLIKSVGGSLVITRGSRIVANGTATRPVVMTSGQPAGQRQAGDWGGLLVLGNAPINDPAGQRLAEGGIDPTLGLYGGNNAADNSGTIRYVRIEFAGVPFQPNNETNGLTMGGVGSGTTIENVQVSFGGDDAFEWFGGTVNCRNLVAHRNLDDDFDADYGFSGNVQFGLVVRDPQIADISRSNGFEVDNDATGTTNSPFTDGNFSNITVFGPQQTTGAAGINANYGRALHVRRSNKVDIFNSVFTGYPTGILVDGINTSNYFLNGELKFKNNILAGMATPYSVAAAPAGFTATTVQTIFLSSGGTSLANPTDVQYANPYNFTAPSFLPGGNSPVLSGADFTDSELQNGFFQQTSYRGAFGSNDWTRCWCEFDPQQASYNSTNDINYTPAQLAITGTAVVCAGTSSTLTATAGFASYNWSNGATSQTISATAAGTYTVTVANARGCSATASFTVTQNPAPIVTISGTTALCPGRSTTLTATGGGTYAWSNGTTRNTLTVTPAATTTYTLTVRGANGCTSTASVTVTINPVTAAITGASPVCAGTSTVLTATGGGTYAWSNAATTNTITVAPTANTTYRVTATNAFGCTGTATFTLSVLARPTLAITGSTSICIGTSATLTATANLPSYLWSTGATTNVITVSPQTTTTYTVTATGANGCTNTATRVLTVNQFPQTPVITANGPTTFCQTGTTILNPTTLSTQAVQGLTIQWLKNNVAVTGATNPTYAPTTAGSYTVRYTNAGGCSTVSSPVVLTINAQPAATFSGVCTGTQVNLTASPSNPANNPNMYSYQWFLNGQAINGATSRTFSATSTGTYAVSVTNTTTNCGRLSTASTINSFTAPTVATIAAQGPVAIPAGGSVALAVTAPNPNFTYQWFSTNTAIAGAVNTTYTATAAGTFRVKTKNGPCTSGYSNSIIVTVTPGQTNMVQQDLNVLEAATELKLFPNPVNNGHATLALDLDQDAEIVISIADLTGRTVFSTQVNLSAGNQLINLDASQLAQGTYLVNAQGNGLFQTIKMVVTH